MATDMIQAFHVLDENKSKTLEKDEVVKALRICGSNPTDAQMEKIIGTLDTSGKIRVMVRTRACDFFLQFCVIQRQYRKPCYHNIARFTIFSLHFAGSQKYFKSACQFQNICSMNRYTIVLSRVRAKRAEEHEADLFYTLYQYHLKLFCHLN